MLRLEPRLTEVRTLAFSPDNRYLLAVGLKSQIGGLLRFTRVALWDLSDPTATPSAGPGAGLDPIAAFFLPDGRVLWVDNVGCWRAGRIGGTDVTGPRDFPKRGRVEPAGVSPDGRWLALIGRGEVEGWPLDANPSAGRGRWRIELDPGYEAAAVAFSPGSEVVAVAIRGPHEHSGIGIYDADTGGRVGLSEIRNAFRVLWAPDRGSLVGVRRDGFAVADTYLRVLSASRMWVGARLTAAAFHPAGRTLVTADAAGHVQLWDAGEWDTRTVYADSIRPPARTLDWGVGAVQALALSPDGSLGAVVGRRGEVVVWDVDG